MVRAFKKRHILFFVVFITVALVLYFITPNFFPYVFENVISNSAGVLSSSTENVFIVKHIETPKQVKAIYMTSCVASMPSFREKLLKIATTTEINSIIIDIKDYSGTISVKTSNEIFDKAYEKSECGVSDMKEFIGELHDNGVYVIGRITSFQDPFIAKINTDWAVKKNSDRTKLWADKKGINYIDPGSKGMWNYLVDLGRESYKIGFDELNYDYIRFPSDGNMNDIYFPVSTSTNSTVFNSSQKVTPRSIVLKSFFEFLNQELRVSSGIKISADLFGMTTTNTDDLNIGQILEDALINFDYVAPMVYPSHYPPTFLGFAKPAEHPYEVIKYSMDQAFTRAVTASSSPLKLRPWLQDFNLGATYTPEMVRKQIQATYDSGLDSWMLWDAGNTYTVEALLPKATSTIR
ncbi:MAG: hypothetical protein NTU76_00790 [Candidatus Taylorbacteria bacterium]|nr:hypothetical protein [Candidatus Taylorbacteria bacterium]